jgi:hypothetical protein
VSSLIRGECGLLRPALVAAAVATAIGVAAVNRFRGTVANGGQAAGGPDTPAYAAPACVAAPAGLPPAYIEVAQLNMFRHRRPRSFEHRMPCPSPVAAVQPALINDRRSVLAAQPARSLESSQRSLTSDNASEQGCGRVCLLGLATAIERLIG